MRKIIPFILLCICCFSCSDSTKPAQLTCEYGVDPLGIDIRNPRLAWQMISKGNDARQVAYQIEVASSEELLDNGRADMWNSGEIISDKSIQINYQGALLQPGKTYFWRVKTADKEGKWSGWSNTAKWTMGLLDPSDWQGKWISGNYNNTYKRAESPWFRKEFTLDEKPERAIVHVATDNYSELYINGRKVSEDVLSPAVKNPGDPAWALSYDVSEYLSKGANCIGLWLGKAWGMREPKVIAQLDIESAGKKLTIGTDRSWKTGKSCMYREDPSNYGDFGGDVYLAELEDDNWSKPDYDDSSWNAVNEVSDKTTAQGIRYQPCPPNRITRKIPAVKIEPLAEGRYQVDFGTNLVGWIELKIKGLEKGDSVVIDLADQMFRDSAAVMTPAGLIRLGGYYNSEYPNLDGNTNYYQYFWQRNKFFSAGQPEEKFCNKFCYAGFRYAVIEGLKSQPELSDITGLHIESDLAEAGSFECSDQLVNDIHNLNLWTLKCLDLGGYMVDCPTREKLGYGGDEQATIDGMLWNMNTASFYEKIMYDWRGTQDSLGRLPNVAPATWAGGGGLPWPGITAVAPWKHYLHFGGERIIEDNYTMALRYAEYLDTRADEGDIVWAWGSGFGFLGDWLLPYKGMDSENCFDEKSSELFCNCYRIYLWQHLEKSAGILGDQEGVNRAGQRAASISAAVQNAFYDPAAKIYRSDDQNNYLMPLFTGVVPESERGDVVAGLVRNISKIHNGHFDTGMLGTVFMIEYLNSIGRDDLILNMYQSRDFPSWGYMADQGATTIAEAWNLYWSQMHSCFASADNWLYSGLAGIRPDPENPGFKRVIIKPAVVGDIQWVKARHDSPYGRILVHWRRAGNDFEMDLTVPDNSSGLVYLPAKDAGNIKVSGRDLGEAPHCHLFGMENGKAVIEVASGTYKFKSVLD